jgi:hypothetical protein
MKIDRTTKDTKYHEGIPLCNFVSSVVQALSFEPTFLLEAR